MQGGVSGVGRECNTEGLVTGIGFADAVGEVWSRTQRVRVSACGIPPCRMSPASPARRSDTQQGIQQGIQQGVRTKPLVFAVQMQHKRELR